MFDKNTWNHLTGSKLMSSYNWFKNKVTKKIFIQTHTHTHTHTHAHTHTHIYIYIYIYIYITMSRYQYGYPWPSFATTPYRPLLPACPPGYIPCRHWAAVCRLKLAVLPLRSNGAHQFGACPYFSTSVLRVWFA